MTTSAPPTTCPRCGKHWVRYAGSPLLCHARCVFTPAEADELLARYEADPTLTRKELASTLGVSVGVISAAFRHAYLRRVERARIARTNGQADC